MFRFNVWRIQYTLIDISQSMIESSEDQTKHVPFSGIYTGSPVAVGSPGSPQKGQHLIDANTVIDSHTNDENGQHTLGGLA